MDRAIVERADPDRSFFLFSLLASAISTGVGLAAFLSRWFDVQFVPAVVPGGGAIPPDVAIAFIISGAALLIPGIGFPARLARTITQLLAALVALIGFVLLLRYLTGMSTPVQGPAGIESAAGSGAAQPSAAICLLALGCALFFLQSERFAGLAKGLTYALLLFCSAAILTSLYHVEALPESVLFVRIGAETAWTLFILSSVLLFAHPDGVPMPADLINVIAIAVAYAGTAKLGFRLAIPPGNISVVWPPSGIALAAILLCGPRAWPGVAFGSFIANSSFFSGITDPFSLDALGAASMIAAGSTLQALLGAALIRKFGGGPDFLRSAKYVITFVMIEILTCCVAPTFGVTGVSLGGFASWRNYGPLWWTWWLGDATGVILVAPFLLAWSGFVRPRWHPVRALEGAGLALLSILAFQIVFSWPFQLSGMAYPLPYVVMPFILWAGFRFGQRGMTLWILSLFVFALESTVNIRGPFTGAPAQAGLSSLQAFLGIVTVMGLVLASAIDHYRRADRELHIAYDLLETRVNERTADLAKANEVLKSEIDERKRAETLTQKIEERFRLLVEGVKDYAILMLDPRGKVISWNEGAKHIEGYEASEILGRDISTFFPEEDRKERPSLLLKTAVRDGRSEEQGWRIRKDGSRYWASVVITALKDPEGTLYGFAKITRDMSEQKKREEELQMLANELERRLLELHIVHKELESFSYSVSHDLRAPLRHIDGFVDLLRTEIRDALGEKSLHYLNVISESARRMALLIDELLVFSRMGRVEMRATTVETESVVRDSIRSLEMDAKGRVIDWRIGPLPEIRADPTLLGLVFTNLISNALKYTRTRGEAVIEIGCVPENNHEACFFVRDNGVGFDMKYQEKLFGVFQRLHRTEDFEGVGIGLANVRRIVQRHGGRTWAEGAVDRGATFYFTIPGNPERSNRG
jgi:PAS domain S-box-containing protein